MTGSIGLGRSLLIYAACSVLALFIGFLVATPMARTTVLFLALTLTVLAFPVMLRWHYPLLIYGWHASMILFFLPGQPYLWMLMTVISLGIAVLNYSLNKRQTFIFVPAIIWPLLAIAAVVMATAQLTGGIGIRSLGSDVYGGKRYFLLLIAIAGYFALTSRPIPFELGPRYVYGYFLGGATAVISNLIYVGGPSLYFLYRIFPADSTFSSIQTGSDFFLRLSGVTWASVYTLLFMLARYGITGLLDLAHPWRLVAAVALFATSTIGGFRSVLVLLGCVFWLQFFLEGLHRSRFFIILLLALALGFALLVPFADRLPISVQRTLSFLPIKINRVAEIDARYTLEWRLDMWKVLVREVPKYLLVGKGYAVSPADIYLAEEGVRRGLYQPIEPAMITSNYHSGPLTLLIPFGIWGALAFAWLSLSLAWVLSRNMRFSAPRLQRINTFLFAYFLTRLFFFLTLYGDFATDLVVFTGIAGLSVALNHGVRSKEKLAQETAEAAEVAENAEAATQEAPA